MKNSFLKDLFLDINVYGLINLSDKQMFSINIFEPLFWDLDIVKTIFL